MEQIYYQIQHCNVYQATFYYTLIQGHKISRAISDL